MSTHTHKLGRYRLTAAERMLGPPKARKRRGWSGKMRRGRRAQGAADLLKRLRRRGRA